MPDRLQHAIERAADVGAATSVGAAATSWVVTANEYLQLIATLVAIIAGGAAAWYHIKRARKL